MEKNNNLVIIIMGVIIVILTVLCILFATGTISLNNNKCHIADNVNGKESEEKNDGDQLYKEVYNEVIKQYSEVINSNLANDHDYSSSYPYAYNEIMIIDAVKKKDWYYTYYDINHDNIMELLVANTYENEKFVDIIYSHNGNNIVTIDSYMARDRLYGIYDNGIIVGNGSGGALYSGYDFSTIKDDLSLDSKHYSITYKADNSGSIEKIELDGNIVNYNSIDELINSNTNNGKKIDLNNLTWTQIK
ncbi:MAG: hypothetical protein VZS44_07030 [Bacilli bacterium]|nr:hypothetical protein [Bacilli bacterium]